MRQTQPCEELVEESMGGIISSLTTERKLARSLQKNTRLNLLVDEWEVRLDDPVGPMPLAFAPSCPSSPQLPLAPLHTSLTASTYLRSLKGISL